MNVVKQCKHCDKVPKLTSNNALFQHYNIIIIKFPRVTKVTGINMKMSYSNSIITSTASYPLCKTFGHSSKSPGPLGRGSAWCGRVRRTGEVGKEAIWTHSVVGKRWADGSRQRKRKALWLRRSSATARSRPKLASELREGTELMYIYCKFFVVHGPIYWSRRYRLDLDL